MPFRSKMIVGIALIEALFLSAILISSLAVLSQSQRHALALRARSDARLFGAACANALISEDVASLRRIVREVAREPGVVYAAARDGRGRVLARAGRAETRVLIRRVDHIAVDGTRYGEVEVGLSPHGFGATLRADQRRILVIAVSEMLLAGLFSWLLGGYLMRQITALESGTARIANGEFGFRLPLAGRDELARLIAGFNAMSAKLADLQAIADRRHQEVVALNAQLEARVHERTQTLADTNRKLAYLATHDSLTGLPNRILLKDRLLQAIRAQRRDERPFVLMILDLDGFKDINDATGHEAGDRLLQVMAQRLVANARESDTVARLGGDEFALLLPAVAAPEHAEARARSFLGALAEPVTLGAETVRITASAGAAFCPRHGEDVGDLLRRADCAMYEAKRKRLGYALFETAMEAEGNDRLHGKADLERALTHGELLLHYQPRVDLASGTTRGVEALVRRQHPTLGLLAPARFVPVAERAHLSEALTLEVLRQAAHQARCWADAGHPLPVAVNISAINLEDTQFPQHVERLLREAGIAPSLIEMEMSETALMRDPERVQQTIRFLNGQGVKVSIEGFGSDDSSLFHLRGLPIAGIAIDKSFLTDLQANRNDRVIVRSIIDLGHGLGLTVVGKGIETESVRAILADLGCDIGQGDHFAQPLAVTDFEAWWRWQR